MGPKLFRRLLLAAGLAAGLVTPALAEVGEVRIAKQYGIGYLPLMIMEHDRLLEKHAAAAGLGNTTTKWMTFAGAGAMNEAMIAGALDFASIGPPGIILLWAKTKGTPQEIRGVCSLTSVPLYLNTRAPNVHSIKDFGSANKIALASVKISTMAVVLQMAAEKEFGQYDKLDHLTITRAHPDAMTAMLSGVGEIDSHFAWPPFQNRELKQPGIRLVLNSYDVTGGPATTVAMATSARFRNANPKTTAAFVAALDEANGIIRKDPARAAEMYLKISGDTDTVANIVEMLEPQGFTTTPQQMMLFAEFMHRIGTVKEKPASWKDLFFAEAHGLPGS